MVRIVLSTARRLALKVASYGLMHLVVAILVAYVLTQDWRIALAVGVVEPIFQTLAYTIHDRIWHRIEQRKMRSGLEETAEAISARLVLMDAGEQSRIHGPVQHVSHPAHHHGHGHHHGHSHALPRDLKQIALKTVTYGLMHFTVAVLVAYALTQNWRVALTIGMVEPLVQTIFFTAHDRLWSRIDSRRHSEAEAA